MKKLLDFNEHLLVEWVASTFNNDSYLLGRWIPSSNLYQLFLSNTEDLLKKMPVFAIFSRTMTKLAQRKTINLYGERFGIKKQLYFISLDASMIKKTTNSKLSLL